MAIQDHDVGKNNNKSGYIFNGYIAMDAAVALEAFGDIVLPETAKDAGLNGDKSWMYQVDNWYEYVVAGQDRLLASEWYKLFRINPDEVNPDDYRSTLTWRNRLVDVPTEKVFNFYSSTEDVLRNWNGDKLLDEIVDIDILKLQFEQRFSRCSWVKQEKFKGRIKWLLPFSWANLAGAASLYCGWSINKADYPEACEDETVPYCKCTATVDGGKECTRPIQPGSPELDKELLKDEELKTTPFFSLDNGETPNLEALVGDPASASDFLTKKMSESPLAEYYLHNMKAFEAISVRDWLLAEAFPATSFAMGSNINFQLDEFTNNLDMSMTMKTDDSRWPAREEIITGNREWRHSDYRDMAYQHVFRLFYNIKVIVTKGN